MEASEASNTETRGEGDAIEVLFGQALQVHRDGFRGLIILDLDCPTADTVRVRIEQEARGVHRAQGLLRAVVRTLGAPG